MTDDRSKTDDAWVDALEGKPDEGSDESVQDARLIRAAIEAQDELTSERITDADVEAAKQRLIARLGGDDGSLGTSDDETSEQSTVVDRSSRRPARRRPWPKPTC